MSTSKVLLGCWLGLAAFSVATVSLGHAGGGRTLGVLVLLLALGKAWLTADGFMELRHAPRLWRGLLLGWPLAMSAGIWLTL